MPKPDRVKSLNLGANLEAMEVARAQRLGLVYRETQVFSYGPSHYSKVLPCSGLEVSEGVGKDYLSFEALSEFNPRITKWVTIIRVCDMDSTILSFCQEFDNKANSLSLVKEVGQRMGDLKSLPNLKILNQWLYPLGVSLDWV